MRNKPSRKYSLINHMIWPIGPATDKLYIMYHTGLITVFICYHQRKSEIIRFFARVAQTFDLLLLRI